MKGKETWGKVEPRDSKDNIFFGQNFEQIKKYDRKF